MKSNNIPSRRFRAILMTLTSIATLAFAFAPGAVCNAAETTSANANNIRDFNKDTNEIAPGRWAYGWFGVRSFADPKAKLSLFTSALQPERTGGQPNWAVDVKKRERAWVLLADGTAYADRADLAWIYQVPATLAASGQVKITGTATSGQDTKNLRIYVIADELLPASERAALKPLLDETGKQIAIDLTLPVKTGNLICFVQNDTGTPPRYAAGHKLDVTISALRAESKN
jgi:hypothetical protein